MKRYAEIPIRHHLLFAGAGQGTAERLATLQQADADRAFSAFIILELFKDSMIPVKKPEKICSIYYFQSETSNSNPTVRRRLFCMEMRCMNER